MKVLKKSVLQSIERNNKMNKTNTNSNILFKEFQIDNLSFAILKKYLKKGVGAVLLIEALITPALFAGYLHQAQNTLSIQNIYVTKEVALSYINPFKPDAYKIPVGAFIANHKFEGPISAGTKIPFSLYKQVINQLTNNQLLELKNNYKTYWLLSLLLTLSGSSYWAYLQYQKDTQKAKKNIHKRGMQLLSKNQITAYLQNKPHVLSIGNIHIPKDTESKHILVFGASGSGKSVLLSQFLNQINTYTKLTNDKRHYIITDVKPEFVGKFAKPDDFILCPFDKRNLNWSLFNDIDDIDDISDFDTFASLLFENEGTKDPYWGLAAASIFADGLKYLDMHNKRTNKDILEFFKLPIMQLKTKIDTLPKDLITSNQHLNSSEATIGSIMSVLLAGLEPFKHLKDVDNTRPAFSFKKYIREKYKRLNGTIPNLYLLVPSNRQQLMAPLLSLAMDIMINEALTLPESQECRLYFIIDEIGSVNKINLLPDLVTKGRSYGISILALTQDPGLLKDKYGPQVMQSFLNNFGTQIVLRINDASTAKELAENFGIEERLEYKPSLQLQDNGKKVPSFSQDTVSKGLVIASELQNLPPFEGYGKIVGYNPFRLTIPKLFFDKQDSVEHFVPIDTVTIKDYQDPILKKRLLKRKDNPEDLLNKFKRGE